MKRIKIDFTEKKFVSFPFYKNGEALENGPCWGMTLKNAGSMRFRWNEINENRSAVLSEISDGRKAVPVQLEHTKIVYDVKNPDDTKEKIGDGIITLNKSLMPVVTVADCVPVYLYEPETGVFGVVHSGWKGTGIIGEAIKLAEKNYGAKPENFCVAVGAHIHSCCYVVSKERADYFAENFTPECVEEVKDGEEICKGAASGWNFGTGKPWRLSLLKANLSVMKSAGVPEENLSVLDECTCCNTIFGSNRRETSLADKNVPKEKAFTVQAAFIRF